MREELATGGIHAVSAPSKINLVQIKLKDLLLGEFAFQGQRQNHFPELAGEAVAVVEKYVAGDLLRNCGGALHPTARAAIFDGKPSRARHADRSEEQTSALQSLMRISYAVFCLKKKNTRKYNKLRK